MGSNSQPVGVCHRLMNFILNILGYSRLSRHSVELPIEENSSRNEKSTNDHLGSEVVVEFRHKHSSEISKQNEERTRVLKKDGLISSYDQQKDHFTQKFDQKNENKAQEMDERGKGLKTIATIKKTEGEGERMKRKEAILLADQEDKESNETHKDEKSRAARRLGSLLSINEKSDEFIRSRKNAMRRNYSTDPDKKS